MELGIVYSPVRREDVAESIPQDIKALFGCVAEEFQELEKYLAPEALPVSPEIHDLVAYSLEGKGKRIRPGLFFLLSRLLGYQGQHRACLAACTELIHLASLLHDDVVDGSTLRRHRATTNIVWGNQQAILLGDLLYSHTSVLMTQAKSTDIVEAFAAAIRDMSEAELVQLRYLYDTTITADTYYEIVRGKTSSLISATAAVAGYISQVPEDCVRDLRQFGNLVGTAFQVIDDSMDYLGADEVAGKAVHCDFQDGKITLPLLLARDKATPEEQTFIRELSGRTPSEEECEKVRQLVHKYEGAQLAMNVASELTQKALDLLSTSFPPSEARHALDSFTRLLLMRTH